MTAYLLSLLGASLTVALINLLAPDSAAGHLRFISSLFLVCVLVSPLPSALGSLEGITDGIGGITDESTPSTDPSAEIEEAMNSASKVYFAQTLTRMLTERFAISEGEIRCSIRWAEGDALQPERVTVILSGSAKWKDPEEIEAFVSSLLGCECVSAIE